MSKGIVWGAMLKSFREEARLSQDELAVKLSQLGTDLIKEGKEKELDALKRIEADIYAPIDKSKISRLENGKALVPRERSVHLAFIYCFCRIGIIDLAKANAWLQLADQRDINSDEFQVLFVTELPSIGISQITSAEVAKRQSQTIPDSLFETNRMIKAEPQSNISDSLIAAIRSTTLSSSYMPIVEKLLEYLFTDDIHSPGIIVLYGPKGVGKNRVVFEVAHKLKTSNILAIYFQIIPTENPVDSLNKLIRELIDCFPDLSKTEDIDSQKWSIEQSIRKNEYQIVLILDGLHSKVEDQFLAYLSSFYPLRNLVKILLTSLSDLIVTPIVKTEKRLQ